MKIKFGEYVTKSSEDVDKFSDEILLNITVLDDLYISATHLADRRSDKQLLDEFDEVSANLAGVTCDHECEDGLNLFTPYLHTGRKDKA